MPSRQTFVLTRLISVHSAILAIPCGMLLVGGGRVLVPVSVNKVPNGVRSLSVVTGLVPEARVSVPDKLDLVPGELQRVPEEMVLRL